MLTQRICSLEQDKIILLFFLQHSQLLWADSISFQEMIMGFPGMLENYLPQDKRLASMSLIPLEVRPHSPPSSSSIPNAILAFSDSKKNGFSVLIQHSGVKHVTYILSNPGFLQLGEQLALLKVFVSLSVFSLTSCMQFRLFLLCPLPKSKNKQILFKCPCCSYKTH